MICPNCNGSMSPNTRKKPGSKMPDWVCDQANGECYTTSAKDGKQYPTGAWNPSPTAPRVVSATTSVVGPAPIKQQPLRQVVTPEEPETPETSGPDWEAKDRMTMKMSAWKSACDLYSGTSNELAVRKLQKEIYESIMSAKKDEVDVSDVPFG